MTVVQIPVPLLIKSIPLSMLTKVGPVSPRIRIGSDLYTVSRSTFLNQIVGVTIIIPVPSVPQYCCEVVKLMIFEGDALPTLSTLCILI